MKNKQHFLFVVIFAFLGLGNLHAQSQCIGATLECSTDSISSFGFFVFGSTVHFISQSNPYSNYWDYGDGTSLTNGGGSTHTYASCGTYQVKHCVNGKYCTKEVVISVCDPCDFTASFMPTGSITTTSRYRNGEWQFSEFQDFVNTSNVLPNYNYSYKWTGTYDDENGQTVTLERMWDPTASFPLRLYRVVNGVQENIRWLSNLELRVTNTLEDCTQVTSQTIIDRVIAVSDAPLSIHSKDVDFLNTFEKQIKVYPTVVTSGELLNIEVPYTEERAGLIQVQLLDVNGRLIRNANINGGKSDFSTLGASPGLHILSFDFGNGVRISKRIILQ